MVDLAWWLVVGGVVGGGLEGVEGDYVVNEDTGPFCLFRLLLLLEESVDVNAPLIPFETYSVYKGMMEAVLSNLGM